MGSVEYTSVKDLICGEFQKKRQSNPRYSMRAYAKKLEISPMFLSYLMAGKRDLSVENIDRIAKILEIDPIQTEVLKKSYFKNKIVNTDKLDQAYREIDMKTFELISDWYHFVILNLLDLPNTQFDPKWISEKLGQEQKRIQLAMDRLVNLQLIENKNNKWQRTERLLKLNNKNSNEATKNCYRSILKGASDSLEKDSVEIREHTGVTMAVPKSSINVAKMKIKEFKRELMDILDNCGEADSVYQLAVQFFPVVFDEEERSKSE